MLFPNSVRASVVSCTLFVAHLLRENVIALKLSGTMKRMVGSKEDDAVASPQADRDQ